VDAFPVSEQLPAPTLPGGGVQQLREPREQHGDSPPIHKIDDELVAYHSDFPRTRSRFNRQSTHAMNGSGLRQSCSHAMNVSRFDDSERSSQFREKAEQ
jgi:hypothetical protein